MKPRQRAQARPSGNVHGVLVVDKPCGPTSHDIVSRVRRIFGTRRVGHAGTLDPMATGVLVILLGEATKLSSVLSTLSKIYVAEVRFGTATDTLDAEGKITKTCTLPLNWLADEQLEEALLRERQRTLQMPPQVSAIKVAGKRAYELARKGLTAELAPRDVRVNELTLLAKGENSVKLQVSVSKGYYVRSLARDLGETLGVPSHLASLRRTVSGRFSLAQAQPWPVERDAALMSLEEAATLNLARLDVNPEGALRLNQGKTISLEHLTTPLTELTPRPSGQPWAAFHDDRLLALVERRQDSEFRVKRGMNSPPGDARGLHATGPER